MLTQYFKPQIDATPLKPGEYCLIYYVVDELNETFGLPLVMRRITSSPESITALSKEYEFDSWLFNAGLPKLKKL